MRSDGSYLPTAPGADWELSPQAHFRRGAAQELLNQPDKAALSYTHGLQVLRGLFLICLYSVDLMQTAKGAYLEIISSSKHSRAAGGAGQPAD